MKQNILILGAGPAGAAVALGLKRLNYSVTLIGEPRTFAAVEGISDRVVDGLRYAGFHQAVANLPAPSARNATWNGDTNSANTECLIDRQQIDQLIVQDLLAAGVEVIEGRVKQVSEQVLGSPAFSKADASEPESFKTLSIEPESIEPKSIESANIFVATLTDGRQFQGTFLVEARGRAAPSAHLKRLRGPETLSLLQYWQGPETERGSAAVSLPDGWAWMAKTETGKRYLQLTLDVSSGQLPAKDQLAEYCAQRFKEIPQAQAFIENAEPVGQPHGRTSTPILCEESLGHNWLRVGDAAMAVDPLSGNGIFQALSSALQASAVINTLIQYPERQALAEQFYQDRVSGLFYRFARIGRDFYGMEQQWLNNPFWQARNQWPDSEPMHQSVHFDQIEVKNMPVVADGFIEDKEVVVTPDQPLGIWHMGGIALADVVKAVWQREDAQSLMDCLQPLALTPLQLQGIVNWLKGMGLKG